MMKLYDVDFKPMYPVGGCCIILAKDIDEAFEMAKKEITHTKIKIEDITEMELDESKIICYLSGDY